MSTMQGPIEDGRVSVLRSIANSIEVAFPDAAEQLNLMATSMAPKVRQPEYVLAQTTYPVWLYSSEDDEAWVLWSDANGYSEWSVQKRATIFPHHIYYFESVEDVMEDHDGQAEE